MTALIRLRGLEKTYQRGGQRIPVLQGIDLAVQTYAVALGVATLELWQSCPQLGRGRRTVAVVAAALFPALVRAFLVLFVLGVLLRCLFWLAARHAARSSSAFLCAASHSA